MQKLDKQITMEMDKENPDMRKLILKMRERRLEKVNEMNEKNPKNLKMAYLSSQSKQGKTNEFSLCKRFNNAVQEPAADRSKSNTKMSIDAITGKLVKDAEGIYQMWKTEREQEEHMHAILRSLTSDKRI